MDLDSHLARHGLSSHVAFLSIAFLSMSLILNPTEPVTLSACKGHKGVWDMWVCLSLLPLLTSVNNSKQEQAFGKPIETV